MPAGLTLVRESLQRQLIIPSKTALSRKPWILWSATQYDGPLNSEEIKYVEDLQYWLAIGRWGVRHGTQTSGSAAFKRLWLCKSSCSCIRVGPHQTRLHALDGRRGSDLQEMHDKVLNAHCYQYSKHEKRRPWHRICKLRSWESVDSDLVMLDPTVHVE